VIIGSGFLGPVHLSHLAYDREANRLIVTDGYRLYHTHAEPFCLTPFCTASHAGDSRSLVVRQKRHLDLLITLQRTPALALWPPGLTQIVEAYMRPLSLIMLAANTITTLTLLPQ
jgi:hypothetical protein